MNMYSQKKIFSGRHAGLMVAVLMTMTLASIISCSRTVKVELQKMTVVVESKRDTNKGQPFYIVFRSVTVNEFLTQTYQDVAGLVFAKTDDASLLGTHLVIPGEEFELTIEQPAKNSLGVYGFFTQPGDKWKMMIPQPLKNKYLIYLESNGLLRAKEKKGLLKKMLFFTD
jgi:hypothetical protein